ncbi:MAG: flagellar biosynthesis regulator FlaF [Paracoccus sp. (in: a-proteobacteria)]|uniref:flagellar biosynthesis regulator FlaF n=1 Tax=Paracoccus sp. TaxID=267 RepID=UPI0026DFFFCC|nr:flagellar biosynthesis regulator FlaF [Paracoccus sp. (in: a-proteobacteria)]MDO5631694.1 flagellar biosynthesis regulator FlaF [Paracoccus sp. (in: a-proteobacteria)]
MNAHAPYGSHTVRTAKDSEYDVFARVTRMLRQSANDGGTADSIRAVQKNNELWTILAADLAHPHNGLPDEVKAGLISLAMFSVRHGHAVMNGTATADALIEVNLSVMKGLRGEVAA